MDSLVSSGLVDVAKTMCPPNPDWAMVMVRMHSIAHAVDQTCARNRKSLHGAVELIAQWMQQHAPVRIIGVGRARAAALLPANRLSHGGAEVSFIGSMLPMPNANHGGGIIAASASGETPLVQQSIQTAKTENPQIKIIGFAKHDAKVFAALCDIFIGIHTSDFRPVSALADYEEMVIAEILDSLMVLAGERNGIDDEGWRRAHERVGPTGPYGPRKQCADVLP